VHVGIADTLQESDMYVRTALLTACIAAMTCLAAPAFAASSPETRAVEARALRAQIDRMDRDLQSLESQLYELEHVTTSDPARADKQRTIRAQIHGMDHDQELLENRLHELEREDPAIAAESARGGEASGVSDHYATSAPVMAAAPASTPPPAAPMRTAAAPPSPAPPPAPAQAPPPPTFGPSLRQAADPAPYEKAAGNYLGMFHYSPGKWVPVGTRQLAVFNAWDDAFLLDLGNDCPGLLSADRIRIENFSTKVVANRDAVIADGQRCPITGIRQLNTARLP
jgi:hypothetical protein